MDRTEVDVSDLVARHVAATAFADIPASTVETARHVLLDTVGVMLAASGMAPEVRPFIALARASGTGPCAIVGTRERVPAAPAALANGAMVHALDYEDAFDVAPGHPNASLVPALIALAQARGGVSGQEFLAALAVGGDLACRIALALDRPMEAGNWYPPPIVAGFGAAAGAARLLGLGAQGILDCLSLALCQVTMPGEIKHSGRTELRAVREGFPAQAAVQSALLAQSGIAGFERPLEGPGGFYALYALGQFSADRLLERIGERFWIEQLTFKPWPSCRGTHPFIEAALHLRERGVSPGEIERIDLQLDPVQAMLVEPSERKQAPSVVIDAKFSIPFCTGLALARGRVTLDDFTPATLSDPLVRSLAGKVRYTVGPKEGWMRGSGGAMAVTLADGSQVAHEVTAAYGSVSNPLSESDLRVKFLDCAGRSLVPLADPDKLADAILSLESCEDVGALFTRSFG